MVYRERRGRNRAIYYVRNRFSYRLGIWILGDRRTAGTHGKALVCSQVRLGDIDGARRTRRFPLMVLLKDAYMLITKREAPPRRRARACDARRMRSQHDGDR